MPTVTVDFMDRNDGTIVREVRLDPALSTIEHLLRILEKVGERISAALQFPHFIQDMQQSMDFQRYTIEDAAHCT